MAETVHLFLKANGAPIEGESLVGGLGREGSIECVRFDERLTTLRLAGSRLSAGRRQYEPLVIRKRIDKASPLLARALCNNEVIEGIFKFYRATPAGEEEQFFSVEIGQGRVVGLGQFLPDTLDPATAQQPPLEEVSFVFRSIVWRHEAAGVEHDDSWAPPAGVFSD